MARNIVPIPNRGNGHSCACGIAVDRGGELNRVAKHSPPPSGFAAITLRAATQSSRPSSAFNGKNDNRVSGMFRARHNWKLRTRRRSGPRHQRAGPSTNQTCSESHRPGDGRRLCRGRISDMPGRSHSNPARSDQGAPYLSGIPASNRPAASRNPRHIAQA
jgi:hypothetical protein